MNRKQLILILVAGAIFGAAGLTLWKKERETWKSESRPREKLLPNFPINEIARVKITSSAGELNLLKKEEQWVVQERADFPANFGEITDFLRKLWEMKPGEPIEVGESQLGRLELLDPAKGSNSATRVDFLDKNGKGLVFLLLGKKHMKKSPSASPFGGGDWPDGRYLMVGNDRQSVCLVKETFSQVEPKAESWLDKEFFKIEKVKSISLVSTNATNSWKMSRETESGEWKLADAQKDEVLDSVKASSASTAMTSPSFNDVVLRDTKPEITGLDKGSTATIETFDGFIYTLKFGNKTADDNSYYFSVETEFNPNRTRTPGKDEKPEDKEKLDKEFKENLKKLQEKFDKEKVFARWNYLVSKWSVESLLKPRSEMLAPKKEEPKPEENKPAEAKPADTKPAEVKPSEAKPEEKK